MSVARTFGGSLSAAPSLSASASSEKARQKQGPSHSAEEESDEVHAYAQYWKSGSVRAADRPSAFDRAQWEQSFFKELDFCCKALVIPEEPELFLERFLSARGLTAIPIQKNLRIARQKNARAALRKAREMTSPAELVALIKSRFEKERSFLIEALGGKEAFHFLETFFSAANRHVLIARVSACFIEKEIAHRLRFFLQCTPKNYECTDVVHTISGKEIAASLSAQFLLEHTSSSPFIIEGKGVEFPYFLETKESKRVVKILEHLIKEIEQAAGLQGKSDLLPEEQALALAKQHLDAAVTLTSGLQRMFESEQHDLFLFSQKTMKKYMLPLGFRKWVDGRGAPSFGELVSGKSPREAAEEIVRIYSSTRLLTLRQQYIPCIPILQACTPQAYAPCAEYLSQHVFPNLFKGLEDVPQLVEKTEALTYEMLFYAGGYSVDQVHSYEFVVQNDGARKVLGGFQVHWVVESFGIGRLPVQKMHASMQITDFILEPGAAPAYLNYILQQLDLALDPPE